MNCTNKEQETCECEKRGCEGCYYEEKDDDMEWLKFLEIANRVCREKGVIYEFECPICKGVAKASKSTYNGHLHAQCKKCDMTIME